MLKKRYPIYTTLLLLVFMLPINVSTGQENITYQTPPEEIMELADAPLPPFTYLNSDATYMILIERSSYQTLEELTQPEMGLAGIRINPGLSSRSRLTYYYGLEIQKIGEKTTQKISGLPRDLKAGSFSWSPDESMFSFTNTTQNGVELWVVDIKKSEAKKLTSDNLNAVLTSPYIWSPDSKYLLAFERTNNKSDLSDKSTAIPTGPIVSVNEGEKAQNRTYQDLLQDKTDEYNFRKLASSRVVKIDLNGHKNYWKEEGIYSGISFSPDGNYLLVSTIHEPFSYIVPYSRFPTKTEVFDINNNFIKTIEETGLKEVLPKGFMAVITEKRNISWRNDKAASLYYVVALDNGEPSRDVEYRDIVYTWDAPFTNEPGVLLKTINRFAGITWGNNQIAVAYDRWYDNRNTKTYLFNPSNNATAPQILFDRNYQDLYSDPGNFVTQKGPYNRQVLEIDQNFVFLNASGHSPDGITPYLSKYNINNGKNTILWRAKNENEYVSISNVISATKGILLTSRETPVEWANYYITNINKKKAVSEQVTFFENPFKSLTDIHKELITYKRYDGLELSGTLYLPAGYDKNKRGKLPLFMWAYPREYKDRSSAGQLTTSPYQFTRPSYGSPIYWATRGYAVLDNASFPIIGEGNAEPNDNFIEQLVGNGKAAIDFLDSLGYIDRKRVAVGGHSYGAFMTANLLSHSDLFAAGIARSGAYNRSLTPFGFQSEQRNYWEAQEIYNEMSPFMTADKMKTPLLLIHGAADNNSGTFTMQSERYFNALKGLGAITRLVLLPYESHGYRARESVLHTLWEQDQWLEKYVKNRQAD